MPEILSFDGVGPSYWSYMANVMAECLSKILETKRIEGELGGVPKGVYRAAQDFFRLVLEAAGDALPDDPPASINAYMIATESMRRSLRAVPQTSPELESYLKQYSSFIDERLQHKGNLTDEELLTATSLQKFFLRLAQDGDAETYEHSFCSLALPNGMRFS